MNFREAPGRPLSRLDTGIECGFSNFLFVDKEYASNSVLRRIFSLARKHNFRSILIEEIVEGDSALLVEENQALALRKSEFQRSVVHRISFFRCDARTQPNPADFIGYVVFKRDFFQGDAQPSSHVYESVIPPFRSANQNNFINGLRAVQVRTSLGTFSAMGILYAQQNDLTFVCAHVALRTILSTILPSGDVSYSEMNRIAGINHITSRLGTGIGGLSPEQMRQILNAFNVHFQELVHEPSAAILLPTEFQRELYGFIESGTPALLGFQLDASPGAPGSRHVIPVFGHTFNEDTWLPQAHRSYFGSKLSYYPSENWLSTFVVHDDNFGPYLCLPRHFLQQEKVRILFGTKRYPSKCSAVEAETVAFSYIVGLIQRAPKIGQDWYDRLAIFTLQGWLIIRTVLISKNAYLKHLRQATGWQGERVDTPVIEKLNGTLPAFFWMAELSATELFASSRRKFGELLLIADCEIPKPLDTSMFLAARLPSKLFVKEAGGIAVMNSDLVGHSPLYTPERTI